MTATEPEFAPPRRGSTGLGGSDQGWVEFAPPRRGSTLLSLAVCPAQAGVYPFELWPPINGVGLPRPGGGLPPQDKKQARRH